MTYVRLRRTQVRTAKFYVPVMVHGERVLVPRYYLARVGGTI